MKAGSTNLSWLKKLPDLVTNHPQVQLTAASFTEYGWMPKQFLQVKTQTGYFRKLRIW